MIDQAAVRQVLEEEKRRLEAELAEVKKAEPEPGERREGSPFGKREEEATESVELETRRALERSLEGQIARIDHALRKLAEGTYGLCDLCGEQIPPERLEALPAARLCVKCKAAQDREARGRPRR